MFLLVPAYRGSPGQKAVKRLCVRRIFNPVVQLDAKKCQAGHID